MLTETQDNEEIIARVAALDIGKAELVCCVRVATPPPDHQLHTTRLRWRSAGCYRAPSDPPIFGSGVVIVLIARRLPR
ncbi:hypothetical protein [Actinomadura alba]|uniref:Transposase n=1 Tax=Actinomadura alba TaxID=406431 RepID=A0ABR7LVQ5_9ACTN|nr:hypothetical protein [Actinomadura alba]MBC6468917.1 hypothetical protein [Actinomadura alba]